MCAALALPLVATGAAAQTRRDSVRTDSTRRPGAPTVDSTRAATVLDSVAAARAQARRDSIEAFRLADTIKAPLARWETPVTFDAVDRLRFNRDQILSSEATNLADLLDRVPGVVTNRTGWLASAHVASYLGDFARVRVFMDGIEMDAPDPRSNGVLDLIDVHLWTLDEIVIERAAGEVRVWCRTQTINRTTPYTRTDIFTGDLNTNGFRGLLARRFRNGMALQFAGQQFATQQGRTSAFSTVASPLRGDGANQTLSARIGWARRGLSADVYGIITTRDRDGQGGQDSTPTIPPYRGARRQFYARVGYGDTAGGFWSQVLLGSLRTRLEGVRSSTETDTSVHSDTTRAIGERVLAVGYSARNVQLSLADRWRTFEGQSSHSPALRASYATSMVSGGVFVERAALDSSKHTDASLRIVPFSRTVVTLLHSVRGFDDVAERPNESVSRVEAGVLLRGAWITGGVIAQGQSQQKAPTLIVGSVGRVLSEKSRGYVFGASGPLFKDVRFDVQGTRWNAARLYRPQFSMRSELSLQSNWLSRFPRGEFGINAGIAQELRDAFSFLYEGETASTPILISSPRAQVFTTRLELRIQRAVIFYQFHNMSGQRYQLTPGIEMPRQVQMYGLRWEFWN